MFNAVLLLSPISVWLPRFRSADANRTTHLQSAKMHNRPKVRKVRSSPQWGSLLLLLAGNRP
jgi:hypothetical protein